MSTFLSGLKDVLSKDIIIKLMISLEWKDLSNFIKSSKVVHTLFRDPGFRKLVQDKRNMEFPHEECWGDPVMDYYKKKMGVVTKYLVDIDFEEYKRVVLFKIDHKKYLNNFHNTVLEIEGDIPKSGSIYYITISVWLEDYDCKKYVAIHKDLEKAHEKLYEDWKTIENLYEITNPFRIIKSPDMNCIKAHPKNIPINTYFKYEKIKALEGDTCRYSKFLIRAEFP